MKTILHRDYKIVLDYEYRSGVDWWAWSVQIVFPNGEKDVKATGYHERNVAIQNAKSRIDGFIKSEWIILRRYVKEIEDAGNESNRIPRAQNSFGTWV